MKMCVYIRLITLFVCITKNAVKSSFFFVTINAIYLHACTYFNKKHLSLVFVWIPIITVKPVKLTDQNAFATTYYHLGADCVAEREYPNSQACVVV